MFNLKTANQFTELASEFAKADAVVLGVSKDSCESHQAFIDKFGLEVELLADTAGELCDSYGVWQEKEKKGVKKMGYALMPFKRAPCVFSVSDTLAFAVCRKQKTARCAF